MPCLSRRKFLFGSLSTSLVDFSQAHPAHAQQTKSIFMVLWRGETKVETGFRSHFAKAGLPVEYVVRSLDRDPERLVAILEEIDHVKPDLIYTWGTSVTLGIAGRDPDLVVGPDDYPPRISNRPILFTMVAQPVQAGIIKALGPSGRNLTGVSHIVPLPTQMQAMQSYMPVDRIAVIYTQSEPNSVLIVNQLTSLGQRLNIRVVRFPVPLSLTGHPDPEALPKLIDLAASAGPQFLYLPPDSFVGQYARRITELANARRLPSFASTERMLASSNALFGLVAPYKKVGSFTALKAEQILFGNAPAGALPVEVLPEFSYQIRADVAKDLKIYPRLSLLDYAEIIGP